MDTTKDYEKTTLKANIVRAKEDVIGKDVINKADENLGTIYEIALDKLTGKVTYAVLESGSFLGLGGKLFALPWNSIHYDANKESFILNVDKDRLKNAPGFDKDHWPNMSDPTWGDTIHNYYGIKNYKDTL